MNSAILTCWMITAGGAFACASTTVVPRSEEESSSGGVAPASGGAFQSLAGAVAGGGAAGRGGAQSLGGEAPQGSANPPTSGGALADRGHGSSGAGSSDAGSAGAGSSGAGSSGAGSSDAGSATGSGSPIGGGTSSQAGGHAGAGGSAGSLGEGGNAGASGAGSCPPGKVICASRCVDPMTDHDFCGGFGGCEVTIATQCAPDNACVKGTCQQCALFETSVTTPAIGGSPLDLALGDLDGDDRLDAVVALENRSPRPLLNRDGSSFSVGTPVSTSSQGSARAVALGDVNGDARLDLVTDTYVALGVGDGSFKLPALHGATGDQVALADMNGDQKLDIVLGASSPISQAAVLLGRGDGSFGGPTNYSMTGRFVVMDLTGDQRMDLLSTGGDTYHGQPDGTLKLIGVYPTSSVILDIGTADLNNDGLADLVRTADKEAWIHFNAGLGQLSGVGILPINSGRRLAIGDVNGDGFADLVTGGGPENPTLSWLLGSANAGYRWGDPVNINTTAEITVLKLGDLNGDGRADWVVGTADQALHVFPSVLRPECLN